jgi:hypothetical protein
VQALKRENRRPVRADPILQAGTVFRRGGARLPIKTVTAFAVADRDRCGVVPICGVS